MIIFDKNTSDETIEKFGAALAEIAATGNDVAIRFALIWARNHRATKIELMNNCAGLIRSGLLIVRITRQSLGNIFASMATPELTAFAKSISPEELAALAVYEFDFGCEHVCGFASPFGFVPECGCPAHDV